jgi:hypothetical protein
MRLTESVEMHARAESSFCIPRWMKKEEAETTSSRSHPFRLSSNQKVCRDTKGLAQRV